MNELKIRIAEVKDKILEAYKVGDVALKDKLLEELEELETQKKIIDEM
jgi:hypothetical protein